MSEYLYHLLDELHGGRRVGAGRPAKPGQVQVTLRLKGENVAWARRKSGSVYFSSVLDALMEEAQKREARRKDRAVKRALEQACQ